MKPPAFQFYARDFLVGTAALTAEQVGAYIRLLCHQWDSGKLPKDVKQVARLAGCAPSKLGPVLEKFVLTEDGYRNARLERSRQEQEEFRAKQQKNGRLGGRPKGLGNPGLNPTVKPDQSQKKLCSLQSASAEEGEGTGASAPPPAGGSAFIPTIEAATAYFAKAGADYTPEEVRMVHLGFQGTAVNGRWMRGSRPVTDWRAAMEERLSDNREKVAARTRSGGARGADADREFKRQLDALLQDPECVVRNAAGEIVDYTARYHQLADQIRKESGK